MQRVRPFGMKIPLCGVTTTTVGVTTTIATHYNTVATDTVCKVYNLMLLLYDTLVYDMKLWSGHMYS